jgi:hypothetical protein
MKCEKIENNPNVKQTKEFLKKGSSNKVNSLLAKPGLLNKNNG